MSYKCSRQHSAMPAGFTLLELLIGLVLSSTIVAGAIHFYVAAQQAARYQSGLVALQESGHFGLGMLEQSFARAGSQGRLFAGRAAAQLAPVLWAQSADGPIYDSVTLQHQTGPSGGYTCTGARAAPNTVYISQYRVRPFTGRQGTIMQLVCRSGKLSQPLWQGHDAVSVVGRLGTGIVIAGVESFQVLYGVRGFSSPGQGPQRYVSKSAVDVLRERVVSVRVGVLLSTVAQAPTLSRVQAQLQPKQFQVLDELWHLPERAPNKEDRHLRQLFEAIFYLPNSGA